MNNQSPTAQSGPSAAVASKATQPAASGVEYLQTLREVMALLRATKELQGREHISLGIRFNDAIEALAAQPAPVVRGDAEILAAGSVDEIAGLIVRDASELEPGDPGNSWVVRIHVRDLSRIAARYIDALLAARPGGEVAQGRMGGEVAKADTRRAPVQRYHDKTIPWRVHGLAWEAYAKEYGTSQSAERIAERGGFGCGEMDRFLPGWRDMAHAIDFPTTPTPATGSGGEA